MSAHAWPQTRAEAVDCCRGLVRTETIVHANCHHVLILAYFRPDIDRSAENCQWEVIVARAVVDIVVLELCRPSANKGVLDAGADQPAPTIVADRGVEIEQDVQV